MSHLLADARALGGRLKAGHGEGADAELKLAPVRFRGPWQDVLEEPFVRNKLSKSCHGRT